MKRPRVSSSSEPVSNKQVQLFTSSASGFGLPDGWAVHEKPRVSARHVDKYYIELATGLKFRSLVAVHRYLNDGVLETPRSAQRIMSCSSFKRNPSFKLPDDWEIEEKPRNNCPGHVDKYYIEPGTGKRFRSLVSVERYLTEENEDTPLQALIPANKSILESGSGSQKKMWSLKPAYKNSPQSNECNITPDAKRIDNYSMPEYFKPSQLLPSSPTKVNWVLSGPGDNMWNPFVDNSRVDDSLKNKWFEIFKSSMYGEDIKAPRS